MQMNGAMISSLYFSHALNCTDHIIWYDTRIAQYILQLLIHTTEGKSG